MYVGKPWPLNVVLRLVAVVGIGTLIIVQKLRLPRWLLVPRLRAADRHWTPQMTRDFVRSRGRRLPIDQPCRLRPPDHPAPRAEVGPAYRLSEADLRAPYEDGFLAPFDVLGPDEARTLGECLLERRRQVSSIYGFVTDRDRHLEIPEMRRAMGHPAIVERLAQLLGPDLVCWRSQIFCKAPGARAIQWHQASTYMMEDGFQAPVLVPPDPGELFQLTVWIALDPATRENGCLEFVRGTQERIRTMRLGGRSGFYAANFELEFELDPARVVTVEMRPGQALIFSERTIHGSGPNRTDRPRLAFNYRVVPATVRVYPDGKRIHSAAHMGERYDLAKWRPVRLRSAAGQASRAAVDDQEGGFA